MGEIQGGLPGAGGPYRVPGSVPATPKVAHGVAVLPVQAQLKKLRKRVKALELKRREVTIPVDTYAHMIQVLNKIISDLDEEGYNTRRLEDAVDLLEVYNND